MVSHERPVPRVSVGMPVYNGARYLRAALDSLVSQTYRDFELIISDNGSTDGTAAICEEFARRDRRIQFVRHERNRGAVWNFNHVVELARGELFKWAAHDDVCAPEFLRCCVAALDDHPEAVLSLSQTGLIDEAGQRFSGEAAAHVEEGGLEQTRPHERLAELLLNRVWVHESFGVVRLAMLRETGLLPRYVGAEKVLFAELALRGTFHQVPEVLFLSRWHAEQASWIESAVEERRWRDPRAPSRLLVPYHVQCALGQMRAISCAPLSFVEKMRCQMALARWVLQFGKWRNLVAKFLRGGGSAGVQAHASASQAHASASQAHASASQAHASASQVGQVR